MPTSLPRARLHLKSEEPKFGLSVGGFGGNVRFMRLPLAILIVFIPFARLPAAPDLAAQIDLARADQDEFAQIELTRRWLDAHPGDQDAMENLTDLWLGVEDFGMAADALKGVQDPGFVARANAIIRRSGDDDLEGAISILRDRCAAAPNDRDSQLLLASYLGDGKHFKEQIAVLDALIAAEAAADLFLDRASARLAIGDARGALADFRKAAAADPDGESVRAKRPAFERLESALAEIALLDKQPASPEVTLAKGYWWLFGGVPQKALDAARAGLAAWPHSQWGKILEARSLVATGALDADKARADYRVEVTTPLETRQALAGILTADAVLAKKPDDAKAALDRADWLCFDAQYLLASDALEGILKSSPNSVRANFLLLVVSRRQGNLPAATAYANRLVALKASKETMADVFTGLGELAFEKSDFPLALDFVAKAIAVGPIPATWKLKAACHSRLGQPNEAAAALKNAEKR
jgi:tetratricopeptide (TPR) repeat protein